MIAPGFPAHGVMAQAEPGRVVGELERNVLGYFQPEHKVARFSIWLCVRESPEYPSFSTLIQCWLPVPWAQAWSLVSTNCSSRPDLGLPKWADEPNALGFGPSCRTHANGRSTFAG